MTIEEYEHRKGNYAFPYYMCFIAYQFENRENPSRLDCP